MAGVPQAVSETIHASCVAIGGRAALIAGPSGAGKSDLALRLIDRGARLVSDDYTVVGCREGRLFASAPPALHGRIEVRGVGILAVEPIAEAPVALVVTASDAPARMPPEGQARLIAGVRIRELALTLTEPSAPLKVELALKPSAEELA